MSVYRIDCLATGKSYIGSSCNVEARLRNHFCNLLRNRHHNKNLQHDFNKFGPRVFIFDIINKTNFRSKERMLLAEYKSIKSHCKALLYNAVALNRSHVYGK